jgi:ribosome maturation factor RimP
MGALDEVKSLAADVARRHSLALWDVEVSGAPGRQLVRVFVDGDDGVDLDTVAAVSEEMSRGLDLRDPIPGRYTLEVSSPGLERSLKAPEHFAACVGRQVVVKTKDKLATSHRIEGHIAGADEGEVRLVTDEGELGVPLEQIKSARTVFEW